jgi:xanthine dehydrogenase accessory factor
MAVGASRTMQGSRQPTPPGSHPGTAASGSDTRPDHPIDDRDDILRTAHRWIRSGGAVALATVIETWGSAPRRAGSQMVVDADGLFVGSVSGGCVEGAVITEAADVIADGRSRLLEFGVSDERAWTVGLACGGRIRVRVERLGNDDLPRLDALFAARDRRRSVVEATGLVDDLHRLIEPGSFDDLAEPAATALATDRAVLVETDTGSVFLNPFNPPPRLVVVGAVHIAEALVRLAALVGHAVTVIDPREVFLRPDRFAGAETIAGWPDDILPDLDLDARTAVVALTHDPKIDDRALIAALASPAYYVGALGSRRTHAGRLTRLAAAGVDEAKAGRIHAPIGLAIGAEGPAEIAVAILAEITAALRGVRP